MAMVGRKTRVTKDGIVAAVNPSCGYIVVEADTIDIAARLFENHRISRASRETA